MSLLRNIQQYFYRRELEEQRRQRTIYGLMNGDIHLGSPFTDPKNLFNESAIEQIKCKMKNGEW